MGPGPLSGLSTLLRATGTCGWYQVDIVVVANLIELPDAHEHYSSAALDPCHWVITKTHSVELCECRLGPGHVVGHPGV
jgi:hypothetical protein